MPSREPARESRARIKTSEPIAAGEQSEPHPTPQPSQPEPPAGPDAAAAAREALARARKAARDKGLRPGLKPPRRTRPVPGQSRSGAGPDSRDPALLGDQVQRLLDERGWQGDLSVGSVIARWPAIVGPEIAAHAQPVGFDGSTLTVRAESTAWATQLQLFTSMLLGRIEAEVGAGVVTELVVLGPAAPSWAKGRRRVQGPGPRDTYG